MPYNITGTFTYASQANRDAAVTRVNSALSAYTYTNLATTYTAGVQTSGTLIFTISVDVGNDATVANACAASIYAALVSTGRHTSGHMALSKS